MRHRRNVSFEQPSLVPLADMLTNTVGIMLFILIFASLSAGRAVNFTHLPREKATSATPVWMYCSGRRVVHFDPKSLKIQLEKGLGRPTFLTAIEWARKYSSQTLETDTLKVSGKARAKYNNTFSDVDLCSTAVVRRKPGQGEDESAVKTAGSDFQKLLMEKDKTAYFFFFFVDPDSISLFRSARDQAGKAGFNVGWAPVGAGEPAVVSVSGGCGTAARIQ